MRGRVPGEEHLRLLPAHVAGEDFGAGAGEIDHDEAVERVAEPGVDAEGEKLAAELDVLAHENRKAFAVGLEVGDGAGEIFDVGNDRVESGGLPLLDQLAAQRTAGFHSAAPFRRRRLLLEVASDEFARNRRILVADAHGTDEFRVFGMTGDPGADAFPEQEQGRELALIFGSDKRAAHLERGAEAGEKARAEAEKRIGVEALLAIPGENSRYIAETIRAGNFTLLPVPEEEVQIVRIEMIEIALLPGAFTGGAESDLAAAADFLQGERNLARFGQVNGKLAGTLHQARRGQSGDFGGE